MMEFLLKFTDGEMLFYLCCLATLGVLLKTYQLIVEAIKRKNI